MILCIGFSVNVRRNARRRPAAAAHRAGATSRRHRRRSTARLWSSRMRGARRLHPPPGHAAQHEIVGVALRQARQSSPRSSRRRRGCGRPPPWHRPECGARPLRLVRTMPSADRGDAPPPQSRISTAVSLSVHASYGRHRSSGTRRYGADTIPCRGARRSATGDGCPARSDRPTTPGAVSSLYMPRLITRQVVPPSRLAHTPAVETPTRISSGSRGSTNTEPMPGCSPPATPNHFLRSGIRHSGSLSDQFSP